MRQIEVLRSENHPPERGAHPNCDEIENDHPSRDVRWRKKMIHSSWWYTMKHKKHTIWCGYVWLSVTIYNYIYIFNCDSVLFLWIRLFCFFDKILQKLLTHELWQPVSIDDSNLQRPNPQELVPKQDACPGDVAPARRPGLATLPDCFADAFVHDIGTAGVTGVWPYSFRTNLEAGDSSLIKCYPLVFFYVLEMAV